MHASNRPVSEDEEEDDVFSRRPFYCGCASSDVMGCRRPTGGVFTYVSSDTSHAEGVPHEGEQIYFSQNGKFISLNSDWVDRFDDKKVVESSNA